MSTFEKTVEFIHGRTLTITSWMDDTGAWKASAPGFILKHGRADAEGQQSRQAAVSQVLREMTQLLGRRETIESSVPPKPRPRP